MSPSTTSTFSCKNAPRFAPYFSCNTSRTGDSSTIFSKRRCAEVVRLRRISTVILPISGIFSSNSTSQTLAINPVTPTNRMCLPASVSRTANDFTWGVLPKSSTGRPGECFGRDGDCAALCKNPGDFFQSNCRKSFSLAMCPSADPLASQANGPRGRTTGSINRPVATPSRNSSRFDTNVSTAKYCASGRMMWSRSCPTRTMFSPSRTASTSFSADSRRILGFKTY